MTGDIEDRMRELLTKAGYPVDGIEKEVLFMTRESEKGPLAEAMAWQELGTSNPKTTARIRGILKYLRENHVARHQILGLFTGEEGALHLPNDLGPASPVREGEPMPFTIEDLSPQEMQDFIERRNGPLQLEGGVHRFPVYRRKNRAAFVPILESQVTIAQMESNPQKTRKGLDRIIHQLFFQRTYDPIFDQWDERFDVFQSAYLLLILMAVAIIAVLIRTWFT